ncbi:MAG: ABC transporter substrate-binding protein [Chloroflexi bacterium]|nr:ABC transporter substrate-binding protein [Chloroflexota bacterium]
MSPQKLLKLLSVFVVLGMILSACAAPATPAPVEPEAPAAEAPAVEAPAAEATEAPAAETPAEPEGPVGTLTVAVATQPNTLDEPLTAEMNARNAAHGMFDSLIWIDDDGLLQPALAESWEISDDGLVYTFHLRQGVTFHNGEPFNADSVVFSWNRYKSKDLEWNERWNEANNVEKVDDYTVQVSTTEPKPLLLRTIAQSWAMIPPKYFEEVGDVQYGIAPVGTGPFKFVEWVQGDHITLEANLDYWKEGYPKVKTLIFRPIPESSTRVAAIQTGEVDIVGRLSAEEAASLEGVAGVKVLTYPVTRVYYIAFNNMTTGLDQPTMDAKVRQAMNYAVDIQAIIDSLFGGDAKQATGFVATGELGYGAVQPFPYDPEKAKALLAEAGYADGFSMDFACPAGAYTNFEEVCQAIQGYLSEVGIQTDLEIMESAQYWDLEAKKELPPLFGDSWSETMGEAYNRMTGALFGADAAYSSWSDETIINTLKEISITVDEAARKKLYEDLQVYMQENPPFIYLYEPMAFEAVSDRVVDYKPRGAEQYFLFYTSVGD